jgi:sugar phosphate isomerase/epimerase
MLGLQRSEAATGRGAHYLIGLQLYSVRDDCAKDFAGTLKAVSKIGFSGVEFAGYYGHSAEELRKWLDEDHLKCYGSHISLSDLQGENFEKTVKFNKTLGNQSLAIPGIPGNLRSTHAEILECAKIFNDLAKRLKREGIILAFHDEPGDFTPIEGESFWDTFFANTDSVVKIQFDIGNAMEAGVQAAPDLAKYPGRLVSVHVKDFSKTNPKALLGEGDENWSDVIPILKGKNGPRWFIIEQESYAFPPLECVEKCLHNFRAMMGIQ